ncbi:unnamed protein product [Spodoptera littoralis]|uniref:Chitin-binding type-2 domain-containing protein n=1 Tax=Spodoptera littoralis TaxID=7109 RepID=A0A9P0HVA1_SPOLI|nr:unnamed protein product [Spodoptera littoralis]CAH1635036.1 unnamed protein product [Spodoptera littoralis]
MKVLLFLMLCVALVFANSASLCPDEGFALIPHEICNRFYTCQDGKIIFELTCANDLMYDPELQVCVKPHMTDCEGRIVL